MMYKKLHIVWLCVLILPLVVNPAEAKRDTLVIAMQRNMTTLDFNLNVATECLVIYDCWGDRLAYRDPVKGEIVPCLAESYRQVDPTTIEFKLRKGIKFHNGEPFNAEAVRFSMELVKDPGAYISSFLRDFKEVVVLDEYTVRITSSKPDPKAIHLIAKIMTIYPPQYYKKVGKERFGKHPIGTGPYEFVSWKQDSEINLKANPSYFGGPKGKARIPNLKVRIIPEEVTRIAELMTGGVDFIMSGGVSYEQVPMLEKDPNIKIAATDVLRTWFMTMDASGRSGVEYFKDRRVRRAVNHAINKEEIVRTVLKGYASPIHSATNPHHFGYESKVMTYPYDPAKAKALLAEAGYSNGFTVDYYAYREKSVAESIAGYLSAIGIKTNIKWLPWDILQKNLASGKIPLSFISWGSYTVHDSSSILPHFFLADDPQCYGTTPELEKILREAGSIVDQGRRKELYSKAQKIIAEEAYWVPLYYGKVIQAMNKNVNYNPSYGEYDCYFAASWAE